jgi:transcriptional antiterminator RfaH
MSENGIHWYVLRTKPHSEKRVVAQLARRNIETYFPQIKAFRKYLGVGQRQVEPLFPCYMFARADLGRCYGDLRSLAGLRELVRFGGYFPYLEDTVIRELRRRETPEGYIRLRRLLAPEPVRITGGLFAGNDGLFSRYLNAPERVCILLEFLHGQAKVDLAAAQVRPLAAQAR